MLLLWHFSLRYYSFIFMSVCLTTGIHGLAIKNEANIKKILLSQMTPEEHHLFFGDLQGDPVFHLVRPSLTPHPVPGHPDAKKLMISSADDICGELLVFPTKGLLAPHLQQGIYIDGELVGHSSDDCHFRFSNQTLVVAVNNCHPGAIDGMVITVDEVGILHPVPPRLLHLLREEEDNLTEGSPEGTPPGGEALDFHIFHVANKSSLPSTVRVKRSTDGEENDREDASQEMAMGVCATGAEHDMTAKVSRRGSGRAVRPPQLRSVAELLPDVQDDLDKVRGVTLRDGDDDDDDDEVNQLPLQVLRRKTIELAVFCDDVLFKNFPQQLKDTKSAKLTDYVLTLVNAIQGLYHQEELQGYVIDLLIVRLDIQTTSTGPSKSGGDIGAYLTSFCDWQKERNPPGEETPEHWDHAIMLSGLDLHSSGSPSVIGLAWVSGMCRSSISCTMNEGRSFMAVYVVAHEMGHNLGMNHDGQGSARGCDGNKYIMSPSVGPGKTTWSQCSTQVVREFLSKQSCLDDGENNQQGFSRSFSARALESKERNSNIAVHPTLHPKLQMIRDDTPGHQFTLPQQCQAMHGRDYFPALTKFDLCDYLYCTNGVVTKPAHPALEGSPCGPHRLCLGGKCRPELELARYEHIYGVVETETETLPVTTEQVTDLSKDNKELPDVMISQQSNCTCAKFPPSLHSFPKKLCPFLAKAFHSIFDCKEKCDKYDLYIDNEKGVMYKMKNGTVSEELPEICYPTGKNLSMLTQYSLLPEINFNNTELPVDLKILCNVVPDFIRPTLGCAKAVELETKCLPEHIIFAMSGHELTYVPAKHRRHSRNIKWLGKEYFLLNSPEREENETLNPFSLPSSVEQFSRFLSHQDLSGEDAQLPSLQCKLDDDTLDILKSKSNDLCLFLAPSLQHLFNCSTLQQGCLDYVLFIQLEEKLVMRSPVRLDNELEDLVCESCPQPIKEANSILSDLVANASTNEAIKAFCHLLPFTWLNILPACTAPLASYTSEEECPPKTLVVQGDRFDFTYSINRSTDRYLNLSSVEWKGRPYFLEKISYTVTSEELLAQAYNLDLSMKSLSKFEPKDLITTPQERKFVSAWHVSQTPLQKSLNSFAAPDNSREVGKRDRHYVTENLLEHIGQRDSFLAINAGSTMPRTSVGPCSVTCGQGVRPVNVVCVDVNTEEVVDDDSCQSFIDTETIMEPCFLPPCARPKWSVNAWGPCSEKCGPGVQFREVSCAFEVTEFGEMFNQLRGGARVIVENSQCNGKPPHRVRDCTGSCEIAPWCKTDDCFEYHDVEISKDFDYS